jgi:hypothetical protein
VRSMRLGRRPVIVGACIAILATALFTGYFGHQVVRYLEIRSLLKENSWRIPVLNSIPKPLAETTASAEDGTQLSYFGYQFEVPWKGVRLERNEGRVAENYFRGGQSVKCTNPKYFQDDPIRIDYTIEPSTFDGAFGQSPKGTRYEQLNEILSWTPEEFHPFLSHRMFARSDVLLELKAMWFGSDPAVPEIFSIRTQHYKAFETRRLSRGIPRIELVFFATDDHWFQVNVSTSRAGVAITQAEINRTIQTIRPETSKPAR